MKSFKSIFLAVALSLGTASFFLPAEAQQVVILKKTTKKINQEQVNQLELFPRHYMQFNIGDNFVAGAYTGMRRSFGNPYVDPSSYRNTYAWFDSYTAAYKSYWAAVPLTFSLQYLYAFRPWLHFGVDAYYAGEYWTISEVGTRRKLSDECNVAFSVLPSLRFQYFDTRIVGLYSGLALGAFVNYRSMANKVSTTVLPAWQLTFLGLRVGDRVFWTAELGTGCKGFFTTGIGCRL